MKRILALLLALAVCAGMLSMTAYAAGGSLSVTSDSVERGKGVSLTVSIDSNPGLTGLDIAFTYDSNVMTLSSASNSDLLGGTWFIASKNPTNAVWYALDAVSATGTILTLNFEVKDTAKRGDYTVTVSATGTDNDLNEFSIAAGSGTITVTVPPCAVHSYGALTGSEPTCTEAGVKTQTCTECGDVNTVTTPAINHAYGNWTKLNDDQHQKVCANDNKHTLEEDHSWTLGTDTATCSQPGTRTDTCSVCSGTRTVTTQATGSHNYGVANKNADEHWMECGCGAKDEASVKPHDWVEGVDSATCDTAGQRTDTCSGCDATKVVPTQPTGKHVYETPKFNADNHWMECTCGAQYGVTAHTWVEVSNTATCNEKGVKASECSGCDAEKEEESAPTGEHVYTASYKSVDDKYHTGVCKCGTANTDAEKYLPHQLVKNAEKSVAPTCQATGYDFYECSECEYEVEVSVDKTSHEYENWTTNGEENHTANCKYCDQEPKTEPHTYPEKGKGEVTKPATCKETGIMTYTCTANGCGQKKTETIAKSTVHTYGPWTKVDDDNHERVCTVCADSAVKQTAGHIWQKTDDVKSTCSAKGYTDYKCKDCAATKRVEKELDPSNHTLVYTKNAGTNTYTVTCADGDNCKMASYTHDKHEYNINGDKAGEMLCICGEKTVKTTSTNYADLDDVPRTGDITGQIVATAACGLAALMAVAFVFKRKAA